MTVTKHNPLADKINRIETGIKGFDQLIEGGIPEKSLILLSGVTGTGKSIFGMNYLVHGIKKGENGVYVSLQESIEETISEMNLFWPIKGMIKEEKLSIVQPELYNFDALLTTIEDSIDKVKATRLVIDSISIIAMYFEDPFRIRKSLLTLANLLKNLGCTTIAISQVTKGVSLYGVEEFVADGVIKMYYMRTNSSFTRALTVRKMRITNHSMNIHPVEIKEPEGIVVYPTKLKF